MSNKTITNPLSLKHLPRNCNPDNYLKNRFNKKHWSSKNGNPVPKPNSLGWKIYNALSFSEKRDFEARVNKLLKKYPGRRTSRTRIIY